MIEVETIVIGSGPGGYVAAIKASQLGQQVVIIEKENLGGVCANVGCIPSKALISVGHRLEQTKYSDDMGILASVVKVDFAKVQEYKQMTQVVKKGLMKKGVAVVVDASAKGVEESENGVIVTYEIGGEEKKVEADYVLITVGRRPNTDDMGLEEIGIEFADRGLLKVDQQCRTNLPNIFAIGDIIAGPQLAHKASYEGKIAAEAIAGKRSIVNYLAIPAVCFTDPELATVGYTEERAKAEGMEVKAAKFPFSANGRALALNAKEGFVKLVARKEDGLLVGAQIVGSGASEMIAEMGLAIEASMTVEDIALTIHAHPTLGEVTMEAAEALLHKLK
ncbi:FAD-dependent oxidoreductase [Brevibacterium sp. JNUCC-42]|nr:FAD-dependent oxidoreductase [Brevibacterium sp. JNUCC-42]